LYKSAVNHSELHFANYKTSSGGQRHYNKYCRLGV